jgi:aspartyl-tRNA(Asn)/glutamyl-tRNA(Gln) amidotransferase subunit B
VTSTTTKFKLIVGLEIHVQLATRTKLFCGCPIEFGAEPNSRTCPVCLGLPGALPVLNRRAYELAARFAAALNCRIAEYTKWDRKSYYYPDLPKNYQISQYDLPLGADGYFEIPDGEGGTRRIGIIRAHLEEDAGKNIHDTPGCTLVDLNRTGTPLLEIVTRPDITSPEEAYTFCTELQRLAVYLGVSEASMQKGHMRFEPNVNVAIERDGQVYHTPISEVKNLNSFRHVRDAIAYEMQRQIADWEQNPKYLKGLAPNENRGWNAERGVTEFQRGKEAAHDYRYFPDPDLPPVTATAEWIEELQRGVPELPIARIHRLTLMYGLTDKEADALVSTLEDAELFDAAAGGDQVRGKRIANLMLGVGRRIAHERGRSLASLLGDASRWRQLADLVVEGKINATAADRLLEEVLTGATDQSDFAALAEARNLVLVQDEGQMRAWVEQVFAENASAVQDALTNPKKAKAAPGFLTGKVMQISGGKADPKVVGKLIAEKLEAMRP